MKGYPGHPAIILLPDALRKNFADVRITPPVWTPPHLLYILQRSTTPSVGMEVAMPVREADNNHVGRHCLQSNALSALDAIRCEWQSC